jgi:methionyl-tRNA formyltransferase
MAVRPRVAVVVDNPSWILPYAERLVAKARELGCTATLARAYDELDEGDVAFFLGCTAIAPASARARHRLNLVVHESALPQGRGFAPVAWQVLEGKRRIPIVLFEAVDVADSGPIYLRDEIQLSGYELNGDIRRLQGEATVALCLRFLEQYPRVEPQPQTGPPSGYRRRTPMDSALDPDKSLREQFNLLRVVDNERYPAFFDLDGRRYVVRIFPGENTP